MLNAQQAYKMVQKEIEQIIIDQYQNKKIHLIDIANTLNVIGYKTKTGKKFTQAHISIYAIKLGLEKRIKRENGNETFKKNQVNINEIIRDMYNSGIQIKYIAKELNKKGYKSKTNIPFTNSIVSKIAKRLELEPRIFRNENENTIINNTINEIVESEEVNNMGLTEEKKLQLIEISIHEENNNLYTDSLTVADVFDKEHKNVLRDIEIILSDLDGKGKLNFEPSSYINSQNKTQKKYLLTKKGLTLLVMGYTGSKALQFKLAYIDKFEEMENKLKQSVVVAPQKTLSLSEMLLAQAQLNVDLEKKLSQVNNQMLEVKSEVSQVNSQVSNLDQQVKQILEQKEEGLKKLDCIEYSETLPLFKTERTKVRQLVNAYAGAFNCSPKDVWNKLYAEFYYRYKRNIKLLAENRNMKPLDFVESSGLMEDLYNLASNLLRV